MFQPTAFVVRGAERLAEGLSWPGVTRDLLACRTLAFEWRPEAAGSDHSLTRPRREFVLEILADFRARTALTFRGCLPHEL